MTTSALKNSFTHFYRGIAPVVGHIGNKMRKYKDMKVILHYLLAGNITVSLICVSVLSVKC